MRFHAALGLAACLVPALAIFEDDAYHIDYHHALVGIPKHDTTFFQQPYAGSKASLIYTLSQKQVIAAINPKDGALVWRQLPSGVANSTHGILRSGEGQDTVIGAVGGSITAWSASDGRVVWEHSINGASVEDLEILEQEDGITNDEAKDALVLLSNGALERLDGKTGRAKWSYLDASADKPFQVSASPTTAYYISLHTPMLGGTKIKVTSISPVTGKKIDQYTLNSDSEVSAQEHVLFAGANTAAPLIIWTDKGNKVLKMNIIGEKRIFTFPAPSHEAVEKIVLLAPGRVNARPHFLVEWQMAEGHFAEVFHVDLKKMTVSKGYTLPRLGGKGAYAISTMDANVYFTRITAEEILVVSSASHSILGRWPIKSLPSLAGAHPVHGVSEVVVKSDSASAVRSAVLYSNGEWALIRNGEVAWTRPEFLSSAVSAAWAELPEEEALAQELEAEGHQNVLVAYVHRVQRHIRDLEHLPAWLQSIPTRVLGNLMGKSQESAIEEVKHDSFGFHKLVVVATDRGRLAALDVGSRGNLVWNIDLHQFAPETTFAGPTLRGSGGRIEVRDAGLESPIFLNSTTGGLLPTTDKLEQTRGSQQNSLITFDIVDGELKGFVGDAATAKPSIVWTFSPANGERVTGFTVRPAIDPVASIGKVLGDRRVLYKYLNPNLVVVTAVHEARRSASLYLLDSASGNLLHAVSHEGVDTSRPIPSTFSENWFSYSLTVDSRTTGESRGYLLIVSELFESSIPDDRGPLGASSNSSTLQPSSATGEIVKPYVLSQTYHIPEEISQMTVTQTRQGITSRELLVTLPNSNSIVGIPRQIIDPRRPVGRDPTALEASEGLTRYTPIILFDPKWHLNHKYELMGIKNVITRESGLESTSLVFAYGHDIFGTRVTPSFAFDMLGKGFNKLQMLATVAALFVAVVFVAPLVRSKQINALWTN